MPKTLLDRFDSFFPIREESRANATAVWLDRAIYLCIWLTALAAPLSIAVTNIGWVSGVFLWFVRAFVKPRPQFFRTPIDFPLLAFWLWCLLSSIFSYAPDLSLDRLRVLTLFPIAYLVCQNIRKTKTVKLLIGTLIFSTLFTTFWTFAERIPGRGVQVFEVESDGLLAKAGIENGDTLLKVNGKKISFPEEIVDVLARDKKLKLNLYRPDYYQDVEVSASIDQSATMRAEDWLGFKRWQRSRNWRAEGFYNHYTTYAEVLLLIASLSLGIFVAQLKARSKFTAVWLVGLIAMLGALLLTATRASQAAFLLSAFVIVAMGANRKILLSLLALALPLMIVAAIYVQQTRNTGFIDGADNSTVWRLTVWREAVGLLSQSPRHLLVGVGIDSVKRYKCEWGLFNNCALPAGHFHSTGLQIAVETGLPALVLWLLVVWRYGKSLFGAARQTGEKTQDYSDAVTENDQRLVAESSSFNRSASVFEKGVLLGAFGGLIGFCASGLVHYNLGDSEVAMVFFLIVGLSLVLVRNGKAKKV